MRSVISDITGILLLSAVIAGNMPREHHFRSERAGEGLLLGRDLLSKAFGVPVDHVHYLPRGLMMNIDNMACMYSTQNEFSLIEEKGLLLKEHLDSSYGVHRAQN